MSNNHTNLKLGEKCRIIVLISLANLRQPPSGQTVMKPSRLLFFSHILIRSRGCSLCSLSSTPSRLSQRWTCKKRFLEMSKIMSSSYETEYINFYGIVSVWKISFMRLECSNHTNSDWRTYPCFHPKIFSRCLRKICHSCDTLCNNCRKAVGCAHAHNDFLYLWPRTQGCFLFLQLFLKPHLRHQIKALRSGLQCPLLRL